MAWLVYLSLTVSWPWSGSPEAALSPTAEAWSCHTRMEYTLEPAQVTWGPEGLSARSVAQASLAAQPWPYCR
jgi:hypothetical protein